MNQHAKRALFQGPNLPMELESCEIPALRSGEVLVRITSCALCRSDLHTFSGRRTEPIPTILGHEIVGTVKEIGPGPAATYWNGRPLELGSRITWSIVVSCGKCFFCLAHLPQKCERLFKYGHSQVTDEDPLSGGLATHIVLRKGSAIFQMPHEISDLVAPLANCSIATAAAVIRSSGDLADRNILIFGAGALGLSACAMAKTRNAAKVWVLDKNPENAQRALDFGATDIVPSEPERIESWILERTGGRGVDVAIELSGSVTAAAQALHSLRIGGRVILAGTALPVGELTVDPERVVRRMLTIKGIHNYTPIDLKNAIDFLIGPGRAFSFEALVSQVWPLEQVTEAFLKAESQPGFRMVIQS